MNFPINQARMFLVKSRKSLIPFISRGFADELPQRMEKTLNSVTLMGRVGVDPQQRGTKEHPVVTFSLATHSNYKFESGDWAQKTDWHRVAVFKPNLRDSVLQFLKKGQRTVVVGKISYGEITDKDGNQRVSTSIIADDVVFINAQDRGH